MESPSAPATAIASISIAPKSLTTAPIRLPPAPRLKVLSHINEVNPTRRRKHLLPNTIYTNVPRACRAGDVTWDELHGHLRVICQSAIFRDYWDATRHHRASLQRASQEARVGRMVDRLSRDLDESDTEEWWVVGESLPGTKQVFRPTCLSGTPVASGGRQPLKVNCPVPMYPTQLYLVRIALLTGPTFHCLTEDRDPVEDRAPHRRISTRTRQPDGRDMPQHLRTERRKLRRHQHRSHSGTR
ncbi:DUF6082 family protein [Streptomyces sp. NPDC059445]|uniref:DUF6082 family protein n=1 Tax=Streptomyces sp. NPDC059445 TaxID=3346832 RepID=UPI0036929191